MEDRIICLACMVMLLLALGLGACSNESTDTLRVVPGERIGYVNLGATRGDVLEKLGQPLHDESEQVGDSLRRDEWVVGKHAVLSALFHNDLVVQVQVNGPDYSTPSNLSGYHSITEIRAVYPEMAISVMAHDMDNMYLDEVDKGIAFSVRGGRQDELANEDGDVINVFVHPKGKELIAIVHHHDEHH